MTVWKLLFCLAIFMLTVPGLAGCAHDPLAPHGAAEQGFKVIGILALSPVLIPAAVICGPKGCGASTRKVPEKIHPVDTQEPSAAELKSKFGDPAVLE